MQPGTRVRLKGDPSSIGVITAKPPLERAGRTFIEIELPAGRRTVPLIELEEVPETADALTDFTTGKLSGPDDLRRALTHMRMTGKLADIIYSIGATNTEFHAYQFKPVLKLLNSPSRGVLIADEVGLGKTIEAGLIWTELVARFDSRRLLIVCPKPLTEKWREELRSKFNVDARICDAADLLDRIKDDQVRREGFAAIASISAIRPPKNWNNPDEPAKGPRAELARYMADAEEELFDLAVFDEAHHLRNTETLNHKLGQMVSEASDYSVFLSAIGRLLKRALSGTGFSVSLQGGRLFCLENETDGRQVFQTRPDILVKRGNEVVQIIDTKWKRISSRIDDPKQGVSQADVYQMMAYGQIYHCNCLSLLYPHHFALADSPGTLASHRIGSDEARLHTMSVELGSRQAVIQQLRQLTLELAETEAH